MAWERTKRFIDWIGIAHTVQGLVTSEFVRTAMWPTVSAVLTAVLGYVGDAGAMWIVMASSITFMGITWAMVGGYLLQEQKTPENKLSYQAVFQVDLDVVPAPLIGNRKQRRAAEAQQVRTLLSSRQVSPQVSRRMEKGQLGVELTNNASFPISCILASAETDIEGIRPPRPKTPFPKAAAIVHPRGGKLRITDEAIELDDMPCQRHSGNMDILIKYGLPGQERYELHVKAGVDIQMEHYGLVSNIVLQFG